MIPILFEKNETAFNNNGLGRLRDCVSCIVTEERNGIYECDFEYPVTGSHYDDILIGRIIGVTHDDTDDIQPFDIVSYTKPIDGIVTFHCVHISYRQSYMTVTGSNINSLADAFDLFLTAEPSNPFSYYTDKTSTGFLACADGIPRSVRQMLGGIEGSVLDAYGGEYEFDKWSVILHSSRGQLRDFSIRYGVNMLEYNDDLDSSGTYSSCIPYYANGENIVVGDRIDSGNSTLTGRGECIPLDLTDKFEDTPTKVALEAEALSYLNSNRTSIPSQTITVSFVRLQDLGYSEFDNLYKCNLCDTLRVIFPDYNTSGMFKIVKTVWDVLADKYDDMELGSLSVTLSEALGLESTLDQVANSFQNLAVVNNFSVGGKATLGALDNGIFTIQSHSKSSVSVSANSYATGTISATKSGYYPLGIVGVHSSSSYTASAAFYLTGISDGACTINYQLANTSTTSRTTNLTYYVLWVKTTA